MVNTLPCAVQPCAPAPSKARDDARACLPEAQGATGPSCTFSDHIKQALASDVHPVETAKIDKASREVGSLLLYTLLKQMWATIPKNPYFDSGLSIQFFPEMHLEELSKRVAGTGGGIGVTAIVK